MQNETVARRYATAVFSLAKEANAIEQTQNDLTATSTAIANDDTSRRFFVSPVVDRKAKAGVFEAVLGGKVNDIALHTVLLLIRKRREALLGAIVTEYAKLSLAESGREPLEIVSARPLEASELATMVERLSKLYGKTFEVSERVEPELLGGIRITIGDRRVDGSLAGRLDELSRTLFARQ